MYLRFDSISCWLCPALQVESLQALGLAPVLPPGSGFAGTICMV